MGGDFFVLLFFQEPIKTFENNTGKSPKKYVNGIFWGGYMPKIIAFKAGFVWFWSLFSIYNVQKIVNFYVIYEQNQVNFASMSLISEFLW